MRSRQAAVEFDDGSEYLLPEHVLMEVERQVTQRLLDRADRNRVLGLIAPEQEAFLQALIVEVFG